MTGAATKTKRSLSMRSVLISVRVGHISVSRCLSGNLPPRNRNHRATETLRVAPRIPGWDTTLSMRKLLVRVVICVLCLLALLTAYNPSTATPPSLIDDYKAQAVADVAAMAKQSQVMVDMVFSFGELGFQEVETSKYLTGILEKEGFKIERGVAGIPTAWVATWGSGKPVIALGSDIDCIPQASQKPGVPRHEPMIEGAPGHGEGHNSGQPLNITAAIAVKRLMERANLPGTIKLWPGVAEEQLGTKAYYVREGCFRGVDVVLFTH